MLCSCPHDKIKEHQCTYCGKSFFEQKNLKKHIASVHEGKKDYNCDICGRAFAAKCNLYRHKKIIHEKNVKK